jgi:hypothetical protein
MWYNFYMKKFIVLVAIFLVIYAVSATAGEMKVPIGQGWNLVYGLNTDSPSNKIRPTSEIKGDNIKAVYVYLPQINSYGRLYPDAETDKIFKYLTSKDLENSVYWVYSDKTGMGDFNVDEPIAFKQRVLSAGWNFFPVYEEMTYKRVGEYKGSCDVEKIFAFDPSTQTWKDLLNTEGFPREVIGLGLVVKVKNECTFGQTNNTPVTSPIPEIPNN